MENTFNIRIFNESSENMGILYNSYNKLPVIINDFMNIIENNINQIMENPSELKIDMKEDISKFKSDINIEYKYDPININNIKQLRKNIIKFRNDIDIILDKLSKLKNKVSFGGNYIRSVIFRPKVYHSTHDPEAYENINNNIRNIDRSLDWVEKIIIDLYNVTDQDLNILTVIDKIYNKHKIYEAFGLDDEVFEEKYHGKLKYASSLTESIEDIIFDPFMESDNKSEYKTDMSEKEAKATLRTLSQNMINDMENNKDYKVSQYTANIYANIISKNLLPLWSKGFRKFTITLDGYQSFNTFEFKVPKMTQDFVSRFIQGRETINGLIRRNPEINIKMSPKIFHTMKNPDDAFNFFKAAIKYYDSGIEKYSDKLMIETMKLNHEMKHLISTTKLSGIVTFPMQLLFVFDDVNMSSKDTFKISQQDIKTVNQFIRNIYTRYAAPEKEKKQIVDDINEMIKSLRENCDEYNENIRDISYLSEAINDYFNEKYKDHTNDCNEKWITEQYDMDWIKHQKNPEIKYLQEKFGVKKLKKIPSDLVAYITIETESIIDTNDKMMISSYCLSKIEIVEWYIELLEVGSKKYIVPHTKPYLESLRTQLLACFKKIMEVKIINPNSRPIIDIQYPKGYEG